MFISMFPQISVSNSINGSGASTSGAGGTSVSFSGVTSDETVMAYIKKQDEDFDKHGDDFTIVDFPN